MQKALIMEWRACIGLPGYEVSECGDVRRIKTLTRMKGHINSDGYPEYCLRRYDGERVKKTAHTLVAEAFIGPKPSAEYQVAHRDGSRLHCHFSNLRWSTPLQNHDDRRVHGTGPFGERNPRAKISEQDVITIRREYREIKSPGSGRKVDELVCRYDLHHATILDIAKGRSWSHVPMGVA
jgi:hypothetical protein